MDKHAAIHVNAARTSQVEFADYLRLGFEACGWKVTKTTDRNPHPNASVQVVLGPHYALKQCAGQNTLMLDRCFWGNPREVVSLAWLDANGKRVWPQSAPAGREIPECEPWRHDEERAVILNDYSRIMHKGSVESHFRYVEYRDHPTKGGRYIEKLRNVLDRNDVAVGFTSSALVTAALMGLPVVTLGDQKSAVSAISTKQLGEPLLRPDRTPWLNNLAYMNWSGDEIKTGLAVEYLLCHIT